ncbi:unnamed protein product [Paramecium sonneborni]|uniref:Uncharacterized protein n=1 Tax=Paramecium sonneborni TaxID=65129 RepID=A0A8S1PC44_9CILI|nr:unnamed protein product [Paramecium sonneborni]CAD8100720.1 unnamed protein product [Paramecium sonneborni]
MICIFYQGCYESDVSGRKFHLGENILYQIHKQALLEYLKSGVSNQKQFNQICQK